MFHNFEQSYLPDGVSLDGPPSNCIPTAESDLIEQYFARYGGISFGEGIVPSYLVCESCRMECQSRGGIS